MKAFTKDVPKANTNLTPRGYTGLWTRMDLAFSSLNLSPKEYCMKPKIEALSKILKDHALISFFQPIVSLTKGTILGYEALTRIPEPSPFHSPGELFDSANSLGCLWELEQLTRRIALKSAEDFLKNNPQKKLFLNVHPNVMGDPAFMRGFTKDFLDGFHLSSSQIIFEITERNVINDMVYFKAIVAHYKSQHYTIAIDDAGAGYSGLNLISEVNPQFVKIDMQLIRGIEGSKIKQAIVKGLVEFSKASFIDLIAEGVETYKELDVLLDLGVPYAQGYLLRKPAKEFLAPHREAITYILKRKQMKTTRSILPYTYTAVKNLLENVPTLPLHTSVTKAYQLLREAPQTLGIVVLQDEKPRGILTKETLSQKLSGPFGFNLYQNKTLLELMDQDFLVVDGNLPVDQVSAIAMSRPQETLYDFIVVEDQGHYRGIVTIKKLLEKSFEVELYKAKHQNPLTGLPGNLLIEQKISTLLHHKSPFFVYYIDIDYFKAYNDVYGFEKGDQVITLLSTILLQEVPENTFVGHIGGDDFILILENPPSSLIPRIHQRFSEESMALYAPDHRDAQGIISIARTGKRAVFPLLALTCVALDTKETNPQSPLEISAKLASLKSTAKEKRASAELTL
ncbi:MAG TPA: diguanylate cyclase [Clostridiaceae bacterium]|nr:diguanylate cyclase [Clostridiaceae bacterium]